MNKRSRRFSGPWGALRLPRRVMLGLLAVALCPVLVITSSLPANAVKTAGDQYDVELSSDGNPLNAPNRVDCSVTWRWVTFNGIGPGVTPPSSSVEWSANCETSWNVSSADIGFRFDGHEGSADCVMWTGPDQYDADTSVSHAGSAGPIEGGSGILGTVQAGVPMASLCDVYRVCMVFDIDTHTPPGGSGTSCEDVTTDPPPAVYPDPLLPTVCSKGDFNRPVFSAEFLENTAYRQRWMKSNWPETINGPAFPDNGSGGNWTFYVVTQATDGGTSTWPSDIPPTGYTPGATSGNYRNNSLIGSMQVHWFFYSNSGSGSVNPMWGFPRSKRNSWVSGSDPAIGGPIIGAGVIGKRGSANWASEPQTAVGGTVGVTDPAGCNFYWGTKIASQAGVETDEPLGPLDVPPPPADPDPITDPPAPSGDGACEEDGAGFSVFDPTTWAGAAMCSLVSLFAKAVGLLKSINETLLGLAEDIVGAIGDAFEAGFALLGGVLEGLFIPGDGFFDDAFEDMGNALNTGHLSQWQDQWANGFDGDGATAPPVSAGGVSFPSGGCAGPTINMPGDAFDGAGFPANWQPLNACSGTMAQIAGIVKLLLMVAVGMACFLKCVGIIMSSLGLAKSENTIEAKA